LSSPFVPGALLSDRYELERRLGDDGLIEVWAATDRVLARRVTVEAIAADAGPAAIAAFGAAAAAAARLIHPGIVATYDSGQAGGLPFIVTERAGGPTLAELIGRYGPLHPARVVTIGRQLARALEAAHRTGVVHGGVGPDAVLVTDDDRVKLSRFVTAGTRARLAGNGTATPAGRRADVRGCATTLVTALAGDQPLPGPDGGPVSARDLRPGVPPALDDVLMAAQTDAGPDAAGLAVGLESLDIEDDAVPAVERDPTPPMGTRVSPPPMRLSGNHAGAVAGVAIGLLLVIAVGGAALVLSSNGGSGGNSPPPAGTTTVAPSSSATIRIVGGHSFDPLGDKTENEQLVPNLYDGDPTTAWATVGYLSSTFGNLKSGVGVYVTLDAVHPLHTLVVTSADQGWTFSVYAAAQPSPDLAGWGQPIGPPVTVTNQVTDVTLGGVKAGAVLVWITNLGPPAAHSPDPRYPYSASISELALR